MLVYNDDFIPDVMRLNNTGVICYFNSLMQVLFSCSAFNQHMLENKSLFVDAELKGKPLGIMYIKLLEENGILLDGTKVIRTSKTPFNIHLGTVTPILKELIESRRKKKSSANLLHHQQECYSDGFIYFIEELSDVDPTIGDLFSIRYKMVIYCRVCKTTKQGPQDKPNFYYPLFEENPILQGNLDSKTRIEDYIKRQIHIPEDYKCDKCKSENKPIVNNGVKICTPNIQQIYKLARISSIIMLVFNKYNEKKHVYFPDSLDFISAQGSLLHYELIAQVEHYGTKNAGHYLTKCRRPTPKLLGEYLQNIKNNNSRGDLEALQHRKKLIQKKIMAQESLKKPVDDNVKNALKLIDAKIELIKNNMNEKEDLGPHVVFHLNDDTVSLDPNGCRPTPNTYIVVYHLV